VIWVWHVDEEDVAKLNTIILKQKNENKFILNKIVQDGKILSLNNKFEYHNNTKTRNIIKINELNNDCFQSLYIQNKEKNKDNKIFLYILYESTCMLIQQFYAITYDKDRANFNNIIKRFHQNICNTFGYIKYGSHNNKNNVISERKK